MGDFRNLWFLINFVGIVFHIFGVSSISNTLKNIYSGNPGRDLFCVSRETDNFMGRNISGFGF